MPKFDLLVIVTAYEYEDREELVRPQTIKALKELSDICVEENIPVRFTYESSPLINEIFDGCDYARLSEKPIILPPSVINKDPIRILLTGGMLKYAVPWCCISETKAAGINRQEVVNFNIQYASDRLVEIIDTSDRPYAFVSGCVGAFAANLYRHLASQNKRSVLLIDPRSALTFPDKFDENKLYEILGVYGESGAYAPKGIPLLKKVKRNL